jgi:hypothetical protein
MLRILAASVLTLAACNAPPASPQADPAAQAHARAQLATVPPRLIAPTNGTAVPLGCYLSAQIANEGGAADLAIEPPVPGAAIVWDGAHPCVRWDPQPAQVDAGTLTFTVAGTNAAGRSVVSFTAYATSTVPGTPGLPKAKG